MIPTSANATDRSTGGDDACASDVLINYCRSDRAVVSWVSASIMTSPIVRTQLKDRFQLSIRRLGLFRGSIKSFLLLSVCVVSCSVLCAFIFLIVFFVVFPFVAFGAYVRPQIHCHCAGNFTITTRMRSSG